MGSIKEKAQIVRDDINELTAESITALRRSVDELSARLTASATEVRNRGYTEMNNLSDTIRRNPLQSVALAAGCGLVVGLWRRRSLRTPNQTQI